MPLQKLPKNVGDLGKLIVAALSGHTGSYFLLTGTKTSSRGTSIAKLFIEVKDVLSLIYLDQ